MMVPGAIILVERHRLPRDRGIEHAEEQPVAGRTHAIGRGPCCWVAAAADARSANPARPAGCSRGRSSTNSPAGPPAAAARGERCDGFGAGWPAAAAGFGLGSGAAAGCGLRLGAGRGRSGIAATPAPPRALSGAWPTSWAEACEAEAETAKRRPRSRERLSNFIEIVPSTPPPMRAGHYLRRLVTPSAGKPQRLLNNAAQLARAGYRLAMSQLSTRFANSRRHAQATRMRCERSQRDRS